MKSKITDQTWKVKGASSCRLHETNTSAGKYWTGAIATYYGFVNAYTDREYSYLEFIWEGACHRREIQRGYTATVLARIAGKFAAEIAWKEQRGEP